MALWLVRAGKHGQFEEKFLEEGRIYLTWGKLSEDLSKLETRDQFRAVLESFLPDASKGKITNNLGQIWAFVRGIKTGDWVVLPSKLAEWRESMRVAADHQIESYGSRKGAGR